MLVQQMQRPLRATCLLQFLGMAAALVAFSAWIRRRYPCYQSTFRRPLALSCRVVVYGHSRIEHNLDRGQFSLHHIYNFSDAYLEHWLAFCGRKLAKYNRTRTRGLSARSFL